MNGTTRVLTTATASFICTMVAVTCGGAEPLIGLKTPPGFVATHFADDDLAHDIYSMTIDSHGRVVVAGRDYVKVLHDDNADGRADRATLFSKLPASGAHGLLFDGDDLLCSGDEGLWRLRDANADGAADGPGELWTNLHDTEHGANGIARGPDGWIYVICGNDAGVSADHARSHGSPVKEPRCGAIVRFSRDGKRAEVVAHGFRNPYDLDFHTLGNVFTVDADGERDHHLPWYAPTRLFDVAQGMEHGWLSSGWQRSWTRPASYFDNVERLVEIGRGSPTGLVVYRHSQFPAAYRDAVFSACWTMGRVYSIALEPRDGSFAGRAEVFLETTGDVGFAPVDLAVGPDGDLFVAVGGRGTRGGVFRVRYAGAKDEPGVKNRPRQTANGPPIDRVLAAPQPLSAWSRATWLPAARSLGAAPFIQAMRDPERSIAARVRAVEVLCDVFDGISLDAADDLLTAAPEVQSRIAWALARRPRGKSGDALLARLTSSDFPAVQRAAWESLATRHDLNAEVADEASWLAAADSPNRRVRAAMLMAARRGQPQAFRDRLAKAGEQASVRQALAQLWHEAGTKEGAESAVLERDAFVNSCLQAFARAGSPVEKLEAIRLLQIALGDLRTAPGSLEVHGGYLGNASNAEREVVRRRSDALVAAFPTGDPELDRELARLLGMLAIDDASLCDRLATRWTETSTPQDDVHFLIVASLLPAPRSERTTARTAAALAGLHAKLAARGELPDRNWPLRVGEAFRELCRFDENLPKALVAEPSFGRVEHALFVPLLSGELKIAAARRISEWLHAAGDDARWTSEAVAAMGALPADEVLPVLREKWEDFGLRDAIAAVMAANPQDVDRQRLLDSLASPQGDVVVDAAQGLAALPAPTDPAELAAILQSLSDYCQAPEQRTPRRALVALLETWTGKSFVCEDRTGVDLARSYRPWFDWATRTHPEAARALAAIGPVDVTAWLGRLDEVEWESGDAIRGRQVFEKRACHRCHIGGGRLGPSLKGSAARFSRRDLFAAIVEPNRDVSPLYQTTTIITAQGQTYTGLLVYDSADGSLLQTSPDTTVRILGADQQTVAPSRQSLMPTGLLKDATKQDLADLYEFLRRVEE